MKLVQFYLFTIVIAMRNLQISGSGYLTPGDLDYLSRMLYPTECSYLTTALHESLLTNCKSSKQSPAGDDITLVNRPELHCLVKLEEFNEMALNDEKAHEEMEKILHQIGRFDLAAYLSEKLYSTDKLCSTEDDIIQK